MSLSGRRYLLSAAVLIPLSLTFLAICLLLMIKRNDPVLIKQKLRIGAMILTFTAISGSGTRAWGEASCYEVEAPAPEIYIMEIVETQSSDDQSYTFTEVELITLYAGEPLEMRAAVSDFGEIFSFDLVQEEEVVDSGLVMIEDPPLVAELPAVIKLNEEKGLLGSFTLRLYTGDIVNDPDYCYQCGTYEVNIVER